MMAIYRLEYNEDQGCFHYDNDRHEPGTHGWVTIAERVPHQVCRTFTRYVYAKGTPTAQEVKTMFNNFISTTRWIKRKEPQRSSSTG